MRAKKILRNFLTEEGKQLISKSVGMAERETAGEIRIAVIGKVKGENVNEATEKRALEEFANLGMEVTRDHTGVLITIFPLHKKVWVHGDTAINERVPGGTWEKAVEMIVAGIKAETPHTGICEAVEFVGNYLATHFPIKLDDVNELSDEVVIKEE